MLKVKIFEKVMNVFGLQQGKHVKSPHNLCLEEIMMVPKVLHRTLNREEVYYVVQKSEREIYQ